MNNKIYFIHYLQPSKLIDYQQHIKNFNDNGDRAFLLTNEENALNHYPKESVLLFRSPKWIPKFLLLDFIFSLKLLRVILFNRVDIIFCQKIGASFFVLPLKIARFFGLWTGSLIYDMRSGSLNAKYYRIINIIYRIESQLFDCIFVVSEGLKQKLFKNNKRTHVIGVATSQGGSSCKMSNTSLTKKSGICDIVYAGTFALRNIDQYFINFTPTNKVRFIFIGDGDNSAQEKIQLLFSKFGMSEQVVFLGRLSYDETLSIIEFADICLSLVPNTEYYRYQPPTKILDYINHRKPVITNFHEESINMLTSFNWPYYCCNNHNVLESYNIIETLTEADCKINIPLNYQIYWTEVTNLIHKYLKDINVKKI